jgi:hypothetical protein
MREQLGRTQTNITKQGDEKKMDVAWESMGEQLGRTPHPSQSRPMAQHSQTNIPPRTSNPQSFAHGYLQRTGEDDIQWQEESEEWRILTPSKGHFCTHSGCGKIFDRDFQLANHIKYDHPEVACRTTAKNARGNSGRWPS